jgi:phage baseplate assembly protein W
MIPANSNSDLLEQDFEYETHPSKTYKLNIENNTNSGGYVDGVDALKQAIYKILNTERFDYLIYSWNYGVEIKNLIGEHISFVIPELERVIKEAIMQDDRIEDVTDFEFATNKNIVTVKFKVISIEGVADIEKVVSI